MKKIFFLAAILSAGVSNAQIKDTCEIWFTDTVTYIDAKTSIYSGISINQVNDGGSFGYAGYAQKFEAPDTVAVNGVCFYGVMDSGSSFTAAVKMYDGASGSPGAMIAGTTHVIPYFGAGYSGAMNDPSILQCAMFSTPVKWEGDYFLGVENFSSSDMYIARNANGNGAGEALAYTYYKGVSNPSFDGWYEMFAFGAGWNFDVIIRPIITYEGVSVLTYDSLICLGDTLMVEYQDSINDSLMYNKFYNPNYATYNGYASSHTFDYGDLSPITADTFHLYATDGARTLTHSLNVTHGGWSTSSAVLSCDVDVNVLDPYFDIADQDACAGDSIYFVALGGYDSYLWSDLSANDSILVETDTLTNGVYTYYIDFELSGCVSADTMMLTIGELAVDLGGDTTLCLNESVLLTAGTYDSYDWNTGQQTESVQIGPFTSAGSEEVVLNVVQGNCVGSDTVLITIDNCLSVESQEGIDLDVFPNPANKAIQISSDQPILNVFVYGLSGERLCEFNQLTTNTIDVSDFAEGVYLLQVRTAIGVTNKKIQIIH